MANLWRRKRDNLTRHSYDSDNRTTTASIFGKRATARDFVDYEKSLKITDFSKGQLTGGNFGTRSCVSLALQKDNSKSVSAYILSNLRTLVTQNLPTQL